MSGSTRYTTAGTNPNIKHKRLKTLGVTTAGAAAGGVLVPGVGGFGGAAVGRKIARDRGWQNRTKDRMSVRFYHKHFAASASHHTM